VTLTLAGRTATLAFAVLALTVGACGGDAPKASSVSSTGSPAAIAPATLAPEPTPRPTPLPSGAAVTMDESLLAILPANVAGAPVTSEIESFVQAVRDTSFIANVDRAAFFVVVEGRDLASGAVAHLRPGVYSESLWRDWRTTYDDGACVQAGGILARASTSIGGREVFVTTCAGGLRVYQVWLPGRGLAVSLVSFGDHKFGEQLMAGLKG
jgi:hypothetical protein